MMLDVVLYSIITSRHEDEITAQYQKQMTLGILILELFTSIVSVNSSLTFIATTLSVN